MPNSGVFYSGGKFNLSKLTTDLIEFAGAVQSLGHSDGAGAAQSLSAAITANGGSAGLPQGSELPTTQQVVDYVLASSGGSLAQDLVAQSDTSVDTQAIELPIIQDSVVPGLIDKLNQSRADIVAAIKSARDYSEGRLNTHELSLAFLDADGTYTTAKLGAASLPAAAQAVQAFSFPAPAQTTLKADMEMRFDAIYNAFDEMAYASEQQDDNIEAAAGLGLNGSYSAHAGGNFAYQVEAYEFAGQGQAQTNPIVKTAQTALSTATTLHEADSILHAMIYAVDRKVETMVAGAAVDLDTLTELVAAYQLRDTEVMDAIQTLTAKIGGLTWSNLDADPASTPAPSLALADFDAENDSGTNVVARALPSVANSDIHSMIESSRADIQATFEGIQGEMEAVESGAGLSVGSGAYIQDAASQYLQAASSLSNADSLLDDEIEEINKRLSDKHGTESLLDNASFDKAFNGGAGQPNDFALSDNYNVVDALNELAGGSSSTISSLQAELDRTQSSIGFDTAGANADGSDFSPQFAATANAYFAGFATTANATIIAEMNGVRAAADLAFKGFENGTGLGKDGAYSQNTSANYIATAGDLQDADDKLDAALKVEQDARTDEDTRIMGIVDRIIAAAGLANGVLGSEGNFVAHTTSNYINAATTMKAVDAALDSEMGEIASDLYQTNRGVYTGFTIGGAAQATFEEAINAIDAMIGEDGSLEVSSDAGVAGTVDLASDVYMVKGGPSAGTVGTPVNITTAWDDTAKELSVSLNDDIEVKNLEADEKLSAPISSAHVHVIHEGLEASEIINAGQVIALDLVSATTAPSAYACVCKADKTVGAANKAKVLGIAFDSTTNSGVIDVTSTHAVGGIVAFMSYGIVKGFDLSNCSGAVARGSELFLDANGLVTDVPPSGDGSASGDYVAIWKIGTVLKSGATAADCAVFIDIKHLADEQ